VVMNISATHSIAPGGKEGSVLLGAAIDERVAQVNANGAITFMHNDKQNVSDRSWPPCGGSRII
jgi:hypothetical protein